MDTSCDLAPLVNRVSPLANFVDVTVEPKRRLSSALRKFVICCSLAGSRTGVALDLA